MLYEVVVLGCLLQTPGKPEPTVCRDIIAYQGEVKPGPSECSMFAALAWAEFEQDHPGWSMQKYYCGVKREPV